MTYLLVLYRVVTILVVFLLVALVLSKRHLGRFTIFDFIAAVTLGAVAGADISDVDKPHGPRIFALIAIGAIHILFTKMLLKNRKLGKLLTFDPTMIIQNGKIVVKNMEKVRYTLDDLLSHLREQGAFDISEVEFAILEPNGQLSVLKKSQHLPATPGDLKIPTQYKGLSIPLVLEGKAKHEGLRAINLTEEWLVNQLAGQGVTDVQEVFLALLNTQGQLYVAKYQDPSNIQKLDH
ncbi:hypothetical protein SY88_07615 [Clostridiales bacterium PH28_bin88]|nr:hypothetical protein SY88_07615 [Clostridiales bacterium PH28_bin88]